MIPIGDDAPREVSPFVNWLLIAANVAVFLYQVQLTLESPQLANAFVASFATVPANVTGALTGLASPVEGLLPLFTSMFLHAGWAHLIGNMLVLRTFGDNIEDDLGHGLYLLFYLTCGVAAMLAQFLVDPLSKTPVVGASGAIAGAMGAYLIRFPKARIRVLFPIFLIWPILRLPAAVMLTIWFGYQLLFSAAGPVAGGTAWWAHIGGFVAGALLISLRPRRRSWEHYWRARDG